MGGCCKVRATPVTKKGFQGGMFSPEGEEQRTGGRQSRPGEGVEKHSLN